MFILWILIILGCDPPNITFSCSEFGSQGDRGKMKSKLFGQRDGKK